MNRKTDSRRAWLFVLALALASLGSACASELDDLPRLDTSLPFTTLGDHLAVWDGAQHRPLFIKGINLGVSVPGTQPGELAATREQYDRWLAQVAALGFNTLRVYTLHYPRFYEALYAYNRKHPEAPLYLLAGAWLDEESPSGDLFDLTVGFDAGIREMVDCLHGNCRIDERLGRAHGRYEADVSRWVIGWVIGREIAPFEVAKTNAAHQERTSYQGAALSLPAGTPLEAWFVERLDALTGYERGSYGVERPVSVASWPTLDPLRHQSEGGHSGEDSEAIDLANIDTSGAPGGYFASYHAYPYYPDFMTRDASYQMARDRQGENSYFGYLQALRQHYAKHPLLIAEFGVPTSWGNAHFGAAGMNHGGETEAQQGEYAARLLFDMLDAGCAGGAYFALIDEWWKRTWIVDELAYPRSRYPIWHNLTSPEQNFGLIAFELEPPRFAAARPVSGPGRVREVVSDADAEFFHVRLRLASPLAEGDTLTVGFDTYGDEVGETRLPTGVSTARRHEFALVLSPPSRAQLYVTRPYDLFGIWHGTSGPDQLYHSVASDTGDWVEVRWRNSASADLQREPSSDEIDEIGALLVRSEDGSGSTREGVVVDGSVLHLRLPWTLLQFADPSTRSVIADDRTTSARETLVSDGIAVSVQLGNELLESERFRWPGWERAPKTEERLKRSAEIFARALHSLE